MGVLASVVRITRGRARSTLDEDGSVLKARCADEHQALQHAERKVRTYRKAVLGLAGLLLLSFCGNLRALRRRHRRSSGPKGSCIEMHARLTLGPAAS